MLSLRQRLLEHAGAGGRGPAVDDVVREFTESGEILEVRLEIADVRLVDCDIDAFERIDGAGAGNIFAESARVEWLGE